MKPRILALVCSLAFTSVQVSKAEESAPLVIENPAPTSHSELKPDYLYFTKGVITRTGKMSLGVELTMGAKLDPVTKDKVSFWMGFDIDNDPATGGANVSSPKFGQDIGFWIIKEPGTSRFQELSSAAVVGGKSQDIKVSGLKISGDTLSFNLRSELFGNNDVSKVYFTSSIKRFDKGVEISATDVDQLPRKGFGVLTR